MQNYTENGFIKIHVLKILVFFVLLEGAAIAGSLGSCWCDTTPSGYEGWMNEGKAAKSSKKKICCFTKAISLAKNNIEKADSYFMRGSAKYYYVMDFLGETWSASTDNPEGAPINEGMDASIKEEAAIPSEERKEDAFKDFTEAYKLNPNHSDALFEIGVYYYWKAYRNDAKEKGEAREKAIEEKTYDKNQFEINWKLSSTTKNLYLTSIDYFTLCITKDKICSTAYDLRSRAKKILGSNDYKNDEVIRDYLRTADNPASASGQGLLGFYFDSLNLTEIKKRMINSTVNMDWGSGAIDGSVGSDNVSVRWVGRLEIPEEGSYTFHTVSDDGVALYVNERKIIDNWSNHAPTTNSSSSVYFASDMAGKRVPIVLEWFENGGGAVIRLYWTKPSSTSNEIIPMKYLYPPANPNVAKMPEFWQGLINDLSQDAVDNSDSPNLSYWHLNLDAGQYPNLKYDLNDNLTSIIVPAFYNVSIYQHYNDDGKVFTFNGPCTISNLTSYTFKDGNNDSDMNDQTSCITVSTSGGFGQ